MFFSGKPNTVAKMKEKIAKIVEKSNQTKKRMRDLNVFGLNSSSQPPFPALYQLIAA
jgi:hypothetical protein